MNRFFFLLVVTTVTYSCCKEEIHYNLVIKNMSNKAISISWGDYYPDTTLRCPLGYINLSENQECKLSRRNGWENDFKYYSYLQIFVMDSEICQTTPCDTIKKYNEILKRYQLTLDDIKQVGWVISYP